jgi:RNAse (barnase) inhibitor barstar
MKRILEVVNEDKFPIVNKEIIFIEIDWENINTQDDLYECFKSVMNFPGYFWENWDAFWDIITDDYFTNKDMVVGIKNYDKLFTSGEDRKIFSRILLDWLSCKYIQINIELYIVQ